MAVHSHDGAGARPGASSSPASVEPGSGRAGDGRRSGPASGHGPGSRGEPPRLSKSRFVAGLQCAKQLWWRVHEPEAEELVPDPATERIFARGHQVGAAAREHVPGGVLIDLPHWDVHGRVAATRAALGRGERVIYEASFLEDGVFVSIDILERRGDTFVLSEVKSTTSVKEEHLPDVAIQLHVARRAGVDVRRAELMHLNRDCRHPDLSNLFVRQSVTAMLGGLMRRIPEEIARLRAVLAGAVAPDVGTGPHCSKPYECAFWDRCWPEPPPHHVGTLYRLGSKRLEALLAAGIDTIHALPEGYEASEVAARQIRSVRAGALVVEPGLGRALARLRPPLAFLDFETVSPAIPVWPGCRPYDAVPVQLSVHRPTPGGVDSSAWLAPDGAADPRAACAEALLEACRDARTILAWNAPFEQRGIEQLAQAVPAAQARALRALSGRIVDLLPIVREHVYHPDFGGSFGLKDVLPALVPGLGYDDLAIADGDAASAALETLLFAPDTVTGAERAALRANLLRYCERDTLGLVRLWERLGELAAGAG